MTSNNSTSQDNKRGSQLSDAAIRERLRKHAPEAIDRLVQMLHSTNDNVALGAAKEITKKFVPDLSSADLTSLGERILVGPVIYKPSTLHENMETISETRDSS